MALTMPPRKTLFVEFIENLVEGTDVHYFTLMVEPSERPIAKMKQM